MPRYRSCKNCPGFRYRYLSSDSGHCALHYAYAQDDQGVHPLENCCKPKNIHEMHIAANKLGIDLPGADNAMDERSYAMYLELRNVCKAQRCGDGVSAANSMMKLSQMAHGEEFSEVVSVSL